jgi:hypothetical protein
VSLAAGRSPPSTVIEASALMAGADGQGRHQFKADDARDVAEAAAQSDQYPRWRRRDKAVRLPGGLAPNTRRHMRTRERTARLSALTHLSPIFGPRMGLPDRICPFVSVRWGVFSPFFYPHECVPTRGDRLRRAGEDALTTTATSKTSFLRTLGIYSASI